ncbi:MAG: SagB/ThcOx family dehydrogenase [Desulfovibrionaceae bacterium]|nr:SagB/ThcOx family dehydrogenase [Desulfovibrionaceae bacterium]MBF0513770.1 SagB/ThcOx family dehydrogenase [Desulfovibrionaceae bacterium]
MDRRTFLESTIVLAAASAFPGIALAKDQTAVLPPPNMTGGKPLYEVLAQRGTARAFAPEALSAQALSNVLWAAFGVNRPAQGRRTAPSAKNWQEIDVYAATADGLHLYEPKGHSLRLIVDKDLRALAGKQDFVATAPLNLIYVVDTARCDGAGSADTALLNWADTGFIAQNVYLACACEGLATVVRANIDKPALAEAMKLTDKQFVTLSQTVGHPKA